jgi:hypothetical protein
MKLLAALGSAQFYATVGPFSSPRALRRFLSRRDEVKTVRAALANGWISEETFRFFVDQLMGDFRRGEQFPHEIALAAIAVVLESRRTRFAEDYLLDLARLNRFQEMQLAPELAGILLKERLSEPRTTTKRYSLKNRFSKSPLAPAVPQLRRIGK